MDVEEFLRPPEAPVFQPTHEEFKDPIAYLSKIRPVVVNTGICKIKPPSVSKPFFRDKIYLFEAEESKMIQNSDLLKITRQVQNEHIYTFQFQAKFTTSKPPLTFCTDYLVTLLLFIM